VASVTAGAQILVWLQFGACAAVIAVAGASLSRYGDVIADKTGMSGSWIGLIGLATVTSLPELATGVSAVAAAGVPDIAVGDVLGSCVFNLAILAVLEIAHRREPIYARASQGHILAAAFGIVLLAIAGLGITLGPRANGLALAHVGAYAPVIVVTYVVAVRAVFRYERHATARHAGGRYPSITLRRAVGRSAGAAIAVVAGGFWLPFIAAQLAGLMGWHGSFVGTLFVAGATSLPELAVSLAAVRIGALDMAIANLLGSNLFNVVVLAVDDAFFSAGPLLEHVSPMHALSVSTAIAMTATAIVGLFYRPRTRVAGAIGWIGITLVCAYLLNLFALYRFGD
jgi:cation:H+ antiporter